MNLRKPLSALGAVALGMSLLTGCVAGSSSSNGSGDSSSSTGGSVTIGIKFDQPGLGLKDGTTYKGFDVDVARYVAKELGYTDVKFVETPSAQRETMIQSGQVKMIFATYSITDARKEKVSFAGPYFVAGQDLLVRSGTTDITGPDSLNGKKLCSVTGSTSAQKVKDKFANKVDLQEYDTYSKCVAALAAGTIDAVTTDDIILAGFANQSQYQGKLKVVGKPFTTERYGVGIKKGDTALATKINAAITKMISDGTWEKDLKADAGDFSYNKENNPPKATEGQ
ncbi:glutamate ABC transporter substrate-binding protein [Acidipropionibacterium timonense]|uniref:glutamate ABC transporter substrate-binding protein n=1 Tax=Acidipropionibacterium timonense TaxID=2161818 RepID=UPI00102F6BE6|nr:glutamate ABC transporter substrate-binding protein [Acidipropionibacterium timonense]